MSMRRAGPKIACLGLLVSFVSSPALPTSAGPALRIAEATDPGGSGDGLGTQTQGNGPTLHPDPPGSATEWELTFRDEFNGTSLNRNVWETKYLFDSGRGPRTNNTELEWYIDDDRAHVVSEGTLKLVARHETLDPSDPNYEGTYDPAVFPYTSGLISSHISFSQEYGYFEARMKIPPGDGSWPAFWLMPLPSTWPPEIDVMENFGIDNTTIHMTNHISCNYPEPGEPYCGFHSGTYTGPDFSQDFHTYGMSWEPGLIVWYIDGVERYRTTEHVPSGAMYPIVNLAVDDENWTGSPDPASFPRQLEVDYVRVYRKAAPADPLENAWPMAAGNAQRTSWTPEQVSGDLHVEWYRPIEAYIPQNVQIVAADNLLYVSTARGLYALYATDPDGSGAKREGDLAWRFDTNLPLGNSPTYDNGVLYVGGFSHKLYAINSLDGRLLWSFDGAAAGYDTNPVVADGKVMLGNRDGCFYAIGAHGTPQQGALVWRYQTNGPIRFSAAYKNGVVYFASMDNRAYALNTSDGSLVWKSEAMAGDGFYSYWPVVFTNPTDQQDYVVFVAASGYRADIGPGMKSPPSCTDNWMCAYPEWWDEFNGNISGTLGPTVTVNEPWVQGKTVVDYSNLLEYFEENPDNTNPHAHWHKAYRRFYYIYNTQPGSNLTAQEYSMDVDTDGYREYAPVDPYLSNSGNPYPPIAVGSQDAAHRLLYLGNHYEYDGQSRIMGWRMGTQYLAMTPLRGAGDEPNALSAGGNFVYRTICCDRVGDWTDTTNGGSSGMLWNYDLTGQAPGFDEMWWYYGDRNANDLPGNYGKMNASITGVNGIYHCHGDQDPLVPYKGKLFVHANNAVIAYGSGASRGKLSRIGSAPSTDAQSVPSSAALRAALESEIGKTVNAGHLRPGYYNAGQFNSAYPWLADYFSNPGDTLYTLSIAYPYLPATLQAQVKQYLQREFADYFNPTMYTSIGWADGANRESQRHQPEVIADFANYPKSSAALNYHAWGWSYPQHNFYALWKYVLNVDPNAALTAYNLAKGKLQVPAVPPGSGGFDAMPWVQNGYITGYIGFLKLQEAAQMQQADSALRAQVRNELDSLLRNRVSTFSKDTYYPTINDYVKRTMNISRNFMFLVPEFHDELVRLGLYASFKNSVHTALNEYTNVGPYWFVSRYTASIAESTTQNLYDVPALFQAKAFLLRESQEELARWLDVPAFARGDLFYVQNLIAAIEAPAATAPTFVDVPFSHPYHDDIEALFRAGYTAGCNTAPLMYCPEQTMNRAESSVFVERGIHTASYDPPAPGMQVFADLALDSWAVKWVNGLWEDRYTAGCGTNPLIYCPWQGHTRAEGCVFYMRMLNGSTYDPPQPETQTFSDVPLDTWYAKWVQAGHDAGLLSPCQATPELRFCPNDPLTRALAAHMMVQAKGLTLP